MLAMLLEKLKGINHQISTESVKIAKILIEILANLL